MNKRKEKFPTAWLSKQQKEILKIVSESRIPEVRTRNISKDVAKKFNVDGSRAMIRPSRREKIEQIKKEVISGRMSPREGSESIDAAIDFPYLPCLKYIAAILSTSTPLSLNLYAAEIMTSYKKIGRCLNGE